MFLCCAEKRSPRIVCGLFEGLDDRANETNLVPAAAAVFRHPLYQCGFAVLDSAADCEDAVAAARRRAGGVEYVSTVFSDDGAAGIRVRAGVVALAQSAYAGGSACRAATADRNLCFAFAGAGAGYDRCATGKSDALAAWESARFDRAAVLHHFRE